MNSSDIGLNKNCCNVVRLFYRFNVIDNFFGNYFMNNYFFIFYYELD